MAQTLVEFLSERARRFGSRTALLIKPGFRYRKWSYAGLWEQAGHVASLLQQRGLEKGDRALLWAPNMPEWVVAFFGCIRAGVVVVPLDLRSAPDFVGRVAVKTRPRLAIVSKHTPAGHAELGIPALRLEELERLCESASELRDVQIGPNDLVEIMFTSGTTGDPKGVMLTHRNLLSDLEASSQYIPGKSSFRLLSILPLSHMFEQMGCLLMALNCGASVTYPTSRQPSVLFRTMKERRITTMLLVPQALDLFMKGIEREVHRQGKERLWRLMMKVARYTPFRLRRLLFRQVHGRFGGCLDFIVSGGAYLDPELGEKWALMGVKVIQGYGATETSPVISCHRSADPRFDSLGLPLPGVEVRIAEDGEILVRGPIVSPGYWEAPEQTAAAFQDGWYRTGDLGTIDASGFLHFKGRKKDMIALPDGQKVFPEDIEAVVRKHAVVTDVAVVGLPKGGGVEVHAALILKEAAAADQVVAWANAQLQERQHIRGFTVWSEPDFPRTHTLKVKKGVVLDVLRGVAAAPHVAAGAARAAAPGAPGLVRVLAEVSGLPAESVTPDRSLGGHLNLDSLKRVELLSAIEEEMGVYLDEASVGPETTVQQLSDMVAVGPKGHPCKEFPTWGMRLWCRMLRGAIQRAIMFPMANLTYRLRVRREPSLESLAGPVVFAANHNLHLDNGLLIKAMPLRWRRRLAIAARADLWHSPAWRVLNPLMGNAVPLANEGAVRASLENLGRILDDNWSVLIYPEGQLTIGGPMKPFKTGIGVIAVEGRVPVVPVKLDVQSPGKPWRFPVVRRGSVEVRFGTPMRFSPGTSYVEATQAIEQGVKAL